MPLDSLFPNRITTEPLMVPDHEMLKLIGRGSYGEVWLARNVMGTYRAIKVVHRDAFDSDRPYQREYEGIRKFEPVSRTHDSQVDVLHVGQADNSFYYVMELADDSSTPAGSLTGEIDVARYSPKTLKSEMTRRGPLPIEECVEIGLALTTALAHLHKNQLVHRDIKPSNIIYVNGSPKLADIGLVCTFDATLSYVGTIGFVAPEGPGTPAADLYSLGKVLYEAATARDRQDFPELPTELSGTQGQQTGLLELNEVLLKACEGNPADRYQAAEEMHEDLLLLRSGKSLVRLRTAERRFRWARRIGIAAALIALLVAGAWFYQAHQMRLVTALAAENLKLARAAEENAVQSKERVVALQVANGVAALDRPGWNMMFLWFAEALRNVRPGSEQERIHRVRWTSFIESYPRLLQMVPCSRRPHYCAYSPTGKQLAFIQKEFRDQQEGELVVLDAETGRAMFHRPIRIAASADGEDWHAAFFYADGGKRIVLRAARAGVPTTMYDAANGAEIAISGALGVELLDTTDGQSVLTLNQGGEAQLFDFDSQRPLSRPVKLPEGVEGARLSMNHAAMVVQTKAHRDPAQSSSDLRVLAYELLTGQPKGAPVPIEPGMPWELTRDGQQLWFARTRDAAQQRPTVVAVDLATGKERPANEVVGKTFDAFVQTPAGLWVIVPDLEKTSLLNADTGQKVLIPARPAGGWHQFSFSSDGMTMAMEWNVWNLADASNIARGFIHAGWAISQAFHPNGHELAGGSSDKTIRIVDFASYPVPELAIHQRDKVLDAAFAPGERKIVSLTSWASGIRIWDGKTGQPAGPPLIEGFPLSTLFFSPDGQRAGVLAGDSLKEKGLGKLRQFGAVLVNIEAVAPKLLLVHTNAVLTVGEFSRDGTKVLTGGGDGVAAVWNVDTGEQLLKLEHATPVEGACFSPDGRWIITATRAAIGIWDAHTGERARDLSIPVVDSYEGVRFSADGTALVISGNQTTRIWNWQGRRFTAGPLYHPGRPVLTAMNPTKRSFLTYSLWVSTMVWNFDGELATPPLAHTGSLAGSEFSPDGRMILTCSTDGTARLWDGVTGEPVVLPLAHPGGAWAAHFGSSGRRFITAGDDRTMRIWKVPQPSTLTIDELRALAELWSHGRLDRTGAYARLEPEETLARYQSLRQNHPDLFQPNPAARVEWHERMALAAEQGKFWPSVIWHTDAALRLKPALVDSPGADQLFNRRGYARAELGDYVGASSDFQKAVQIDPDDVFNWWNLAISYLGTGETMRYEAAVLRAIEHFSTRHELGFTMGIRNWALANLAAFAPSPALRETPLEIIRRNPGLARGRFQSVHGIALIRAGRLDQGISLIQTAIAQGRDTTEKHDAFPYLAIAHAQQGLFDEARKDLEIAEKDMLRLDSKLETRPEILNRTVYLALRKEALTLLPPQGGSAN